MSRRSDSRDRSRNRRGKRADSRARPSKSRSRSRNRGRQTLFDKPPEGDKPPVEYVPINPRNVKTVNIPHDAVGSVIGPQGRTLGMIEKQTQCFISIDQSMKSQGYCVVNLSGPSEICVDTAIASIQQVAAKWEQHPVRFVGKGGKDEFCIERRMVGGIVGTNGENLKKIKAATNTWIAIDQLKETSDLANVRIEGDPEAVAQARAMINQRMMEIQLKEGNHEQYNLRMDQAHVAMFLGKNGENVRLLSQRSGADVQVDQSTQQQGFSVIRIGKQAGADIAYRMVQEKLAEILKHMGKQKMPEPKMEPVNDGVLFNPEFTRNHAAQFQIPVQPAELLSAAPAAPTQPMAASQPGAAASGLPDASMQSQAAPVAAPIAPPGGSWTEFSIAQPLPVRHGKATHTYVTGPITQGQPTGLVTSQQPQATGLVPSRQPKATGLVTTHGSASTPQPPVQFEFKYLQPQSTGMRGERFQPAQGKAKPVGFQPLQGKAKAVGFQPAQGKAKALGLQPGLQPAQGKAKALGFQPAQPKTPGAAQPNEALPMARPAGAQTFQKKSKWDTTLEEAMASSSPNSAADTGLPAQAPGHVDSNEDAYRIDQRFIIFALDGETLRQIMTQTGAQVEVADDPNDKGSRILKVKDPTSPQAQMGLQMITAKIQECMNMPVIQQMFGGSLPPPIVKVPMTL